MLDIIISLLGQNLCCNYCVLDYLAFRSICACFTAFLISLIITPRIIKYLSSIRIKQYIYDKGPKSHQKKAGTPTMGGLIILFSVFISTLIWSNLTDFPIWIIIISTTCFGLIGFIDDYITQIDKQNLGLTAKKKFIFQIIIAFITVLSIYNLPNFESTVNIPLFKTIIINMGLIYIPFSIFIIVGTSNAVNLTDGLDGLAIGPIIIAKATYVIFIYVSFTFKIHNYAEINLICGIEELSIYCSSFIGAGLGFLWFNTSPAQIFMGDVGSIPIGASIAIVAIFIKQEIILLLVGGIFVIETISVILQVCFFKITQNQRIFKMTPIHHHFELTGMTEPKIVIRFWITAIILSLISISIFAIDKL